MDRAARLDRHVPAKRTRACCVYIRPLVRQLSVTHGMHLGMSYVYASVISGALDANKRPGDDEIREDERRSI
jgi:hypothetical protein